MSDWLSELIEHAVDDVENTVDSTIHAIDEAVKQAARTLLDAMFPPMVHTQYLAVKSANWLAVEGAAAAVTATLAGAQAGMVLSGAVEKKVQAGLEHLASKNDYARAVNSITP
jgi:hypothetical protein